jgi:hypothetical protein
MLALPAGVAQLVAQAICNRQVVGSSPTAGSTNALVRALSMSVTVPLSASAQQPAQQRNLTTCVRARLIVDTVAPVPA